MSDAPPNLEWTPLPLPSGHTLAKGGPICLNGALGAVGLTDGDGTPCLGWIDVTSGDITPVNYPIAGAPTALAIAEAAAWLAWADASPGLWRGQPDANGAWAWTPLSLPDGLAVTGHSLLYADPGSRQDGVAPALVGIFGGPTGDRLCLWAEGTDSCVEVAPPEGYDLIAALSATGPVAAGMLRFHAGLHVCLAASATQADSSPASGVPWSYRATQSPNWSIEPTSGKTRLAGGSIAASSDNTLYEALLAAGVAGLYRHVSGGFSPVAMGGRTAVFDYPLLGWGSQLITLIAGTPANLQAYDGKAWQSLAAPTGCCVDADIPGATDGTTLLLAYAPEGGGLSGLFLGCAP